MEGSRVRGFEGSKVRGFEGSWVRGFGGSRVRGFGGSRGRGFVGFDSTRPRGLDGLRGSKILVFFPIIARLETSHIKTLIFALVLENKTAHKRTHTHTHTLAFEAKFNIRICRPSLCFEGLVLRTLCHSCRQAEAGVIKGINRLRQRVAQQPFRTSSAPRQTRSHL